jgi:nucleotide-binding universal stress UspA family protein
MSLMHVDRGDRLVVLTVPPLIEISPGLGVEFEEAVTAERDAGIKAIIDEAEDQCKDIWGHVSVEIGTPSGGARDEIVTVAEQENADFIVLGSRGMGAVQRMLLGSVSSYVTHHAPCSVIVVH